MSESIANKFSRFSDALNQYDSGHDFNAAFEASKNESNDPLPSGYNPGRTPEFRKGSYEGSRETDPYDVRFTAQSSESSQTDSLVSQLQSMKSDIDNDPGVPGLSENIYGVRTPLQKRFLEFLDNNRREIDKNSDALSVVREISHSLNGRILFENAGIHNVNYIGEENKASNSTNIYTETSGIDVPGITISSEEINNFLRSLAQSSLTFRNLLSHLQGDPLKIEVNFVNPDEPGGVTTASYNNGVININPKTLNSTDKIKGAILFELTNSASRDAHNKNNLRVIDNEYKEISENQSANPAKISPEDLYAEDEELIEYNGFRDHDQIFEEARASGLNLSQDVKDFEDDVVGNFSEYLISAKKRRTLSAIC